ncbi:MAG: hydrogenase expression/formation protein HypE [Deltaproteobacteria bacterium RIFOXYA12_FULL_58_15]|nr:MAG: hydrogenase expression/formation protein HypE [Deltaproteobacteria bacterium RIFOXYA12_FULL_58_15]
MPIGLSCPLPLAQYPKITMAHGGGGRLMHMLIDELFTTAFGKTEEHDGATLEVEGGRIAITTDSFVVKPLFFPGGNIGTLAVNGTVNDLAACGAVPKALTAGFILEEGLPTETLWRVVLSMAAAAEVVGVPIVTGDTKVIEHRDGNGLFINTTGLGMVADGVSIAAGRARPGDRVLINGSIAAHGVAVMSVREGLKFESDLKSDCAPLAEMVQRLLTAVGPTAVHVLRDPTRGGVATTLCEISCAAHCCVVIHEETVPVADGAMGACEILGLDPLYVANEGKMLIIVAPDSADAALATLRAHPDGKDAAIIGEVVESPQGRVIGRNTFGGERVLDMHSGEQLPRIC